MKTPITDAAVESITLDCDDSCLPIYVYKYRQEYEGGVVDAGTCQLLELDRAALMEALEEISRREDIEYGVEQIAKDALSTARTNFP